MSFGEAVRTCFQKYAKFDGRGRRSEFWWFYLFLTILGIPLGILVSVLFFASFAGAASNAGTGGEIDPNDINWGLMVVGGLVFTAVYLAVLVPTFAAMSRRLHDTGQSAAWLLLSLVGLSIVPIIMCIFEGQPGPNQYGDDPRGGVAPSPGGYAAPPMPPESY